MPRRICQFGGGLVVAFAFASGAQAEPATPAVATDHERAVVRPAAVGAKPMGVQPETQALPVYRSPLSEYRPYRVDEPLRPWKAEQLGGGYAVSSYIEQTAYEHAAAVVAVAAAVDGVTTVHNRLLVG